MILVRSSAREAGDIMMLSTLDMNYFSARIVNGNDT